MCVCVTFLKSEVILTSPDYFNYGLGLRLDLGLD